MPSRSAFLAAAFALAHLALVAPFVPLANIVPAGLGALAMTSMGLSLVLAARWRIVDRLTGGPDKSYLWHRYLGFFAIAGTVGHWMTASSLGEGVVPPIAEAAGEVGTFAAVTLLGMTAAAMTRAIPYHVWKLSHMVMGPLFLVCVFHTFFVASPLAVGSLPWMVLAVASGLGTLAWVQTLLRKRAPSRLLTVSKVTRFENGIDLTLTSEKPLPAFQPGQFATLAFNDAGAEPHPFTIAGGDATSRRFVLRDAGDWTHNVVANTEVGSTFRVGRGVGRFLPHCDAKRPAQLWVAGGVGVTPFLAALETLTPDDGAPITLIYCIRSRESAGALVDIERHAARLPQVDLIVLADAEGAQLTPARLAPLVQALPSNARAFVCGPEGLKKLVADVWQTNGMNTPIHSERFDFRGAWGIADVAKVQRTLLSRIQTLPLIRRSPQNAHSGS